MKNKRILITGGHLTPAVAVLDELIKRGFSDLIWVGTKFSQTGDQQTSAEYRLLQNYPVKFIDLVTGKLWRKWTIKTFSKALKNLILVPLGFGKAMIIILKTKPDLVFSFGGHLALPLVISAWLFNIPVVTHEQTITSGVANRLIAKLAKRIFVSWQQSLADFPASKTFLTGNPVLPNSQKSTTDLIHFDNSLPIIYITGGNQGANTINKRILVIIEKLLQKANVIHQTGRSALTSDYKLALESKQKLPQNLSKRYLVYDNIYGAEIGEIFNKADLVLSRAGANTITDLLLHGKLAVLIPLPWSSHNEQYKNAQIMENLGLALILEQYDQMPASEVLTAIERGLLNLKQNRGFNGKPLTVIKQHATKLVKTDAASQIATLALQLLD